MIGQPVPLTDRALRAAPVDVADSAEREYLPVTGLVSELGDTVLHTPAPGKRIVLRYVYAINSPASQNAPVITVRLGGETKMVTFGIAKRQKLKGPINGPLVINLSTPGLVAITIFLEEE